MGKTVNIGSPDHLTQVQVKSDPPRVEIVDHFDKGRDPLPAHVVTIVGPDGQVKTS
ncbi:MAG: hypothetical protein ABSC21_06830 [Terriglobia bacterium]|jgi:hypothetical protein